MGIYTPPLTALKEKHLKQRVEASLDTKKFCEKIDKIPTTNGARVVFFDSELNSVILRDFVPFCQSHPPTLILREAPKQINPQQFAAKLKTDEQDSKGVGELVSLTLNCSGAVLSWIVVFGVSTTIPISNVGGAAVVYLGYTAATASSAQCVNSAYRIYNEAFDPAMNDFLDSQEWYSAAGTALDTLSLLGVGASSVTVTKSLGQIGKSTGKTSQQVLKGLTRQERKRLTQDIIRLNHPGISKQAMKTLIGSGKYPTRFSQNRINQTIKHQLKDALSASIAVTGSLWSGNLGNIALGIYEQTINL